MSFSRCAFFVALAALAFFVAACSSSAADPLFVAPGSPGAPSDSLDGGAADGAAPAVTSTGLPCDVARVLQARCQKCHAATPAFGAPMPLVTYDDTQRPAKTNPAEPVWQRMKARLHDAASPMPPDGPLAAADLAALDAWLAAGAPKSDASCAAPGAGDAGASGPSALPCAPSEQRTFLAHGGGPNGKFNVAPDAGNEYACFTWSSPFGATAQATAFAPVIDDARVVHHWILYETKSAQPDGAFGPCNMPLDARFVAGWAPGAGNSVLPPDVGQDLPGAGGSFILQLHYWNVAGYTDANDSSGVAMCVTDTPRPHSAAVVTLGTTSITIPPHTNDYATSSSCTDKATENLHLIRTAPHMHTHGTSFRTDILRGGNAGVVDTLVDVPQWDFNNQAGHEIDVLLAPGDVLRTQCHYANTGDTSVVFGEKTENEMCFNFVLVWPVSAITSVFGPVTYCNDG